MSSKELVYRIDWILVPFYKSHGISSSNDNVSKHTRYGQAEDIVSLVVLGNEFKALIPLESTL
jgi:hypothetical protein